MGEEEYKGEKSRGSIQVRYSWYIVKTFVNATMYPHTTIIKVLKIKQTKILF
jgi:hypothetical protein